MKYKTTIELTMDAKDKGEAIEIAGEYLSGNIMSGVDMKCMTKRVTLYNGKVIATIAVSLALVIVAFAVGLETKAGHNFIQSSPAISAVQPPLKTSADANKDAAFKKAWEDKKTAEIINYIKR
jgi:hypothetical protein